jgi:hypothetical protein
MKQLLTAQASPSACRIPYACISVQLLLFLFLWWWWRCCWCWFTGSTLVISVIPGRVSRYLPDRQLLAEVPLEEERFGDMAPDMLYIRSLVQLSLSPLLSGGGLKLLPDRQVLTQVPMEEERFEDMAPDMLWQEPPPCVIVAVISAGEESVAAPYEQERERAFPPYVWDYGMPLVDPAEAMPEPEAVGVPIRQIPTETPLVQAAPQTAMPQVWRYGG